jgi:signal peptidase I
VRAHGDRPAMKAAIRGGSMAPTLRHGDVAILDVNAREPRPGQVWVALRGRKPIIHRVVRVSGGLVAMRGDANGLTEVSIPVARLIARAVAAERRSSSGRVRKIGVDGFSPRSRILLRRTLRRILRVARIAARVVSR